MLFRLHTPRPPLDRFVENLWFYRDLEVNHTRERLLETSSIDAKFLLLENYLVEKAAWRFESDRAVHAALHRLRTWPVVSLRGLAAELGVSQKQMIAQFDARVGFTPKVVSRIFRFHKALLTVHGAGEKPIDWSDLALECGYYDQAHFIHEFQEFSGVSPTEYVARRTELPFYLYEDDAPAT